MIFNVMDINNKRFQSFKAHNIESYDAEHVNSVRINIERKQESQIITNNEIEEIFIHFLSEQDQLEFCEELHYNCENITLKFKGKEVYLYAKNSRAYTLVYYEIDINTEFIEPKEQKIKIQLE